VNNKCARRTLLTMTTPVRDDFDRCAGLRPSRVRSVANETPHAFCWPVPIYGEGQHIDL
jgi:hypothetical protein